MLQSETEGCQYLVESIHTCDGEGKGGWGGTYFPHVQIDDGLHKKKITTERTHHSEITGQKEGKKGYTI